MDKVKARELELKIKDKFIDGYKVERLLDHGKSAAVFLALKNDAKYALKVFDDELILKYGEQSQFERIQRELSLKDMPHPNLVKLVAGGKCAITSNHYLVMEFLEGANLKEALEYIPPEDIRNYLNQLVEAVRHLENYSIVHRDIKPENIMIELNAKKLTLMDLGVIRPIQGSTLTDEDGIRHFIGTLQYSPPEFLLRKENDTPEGWRAINFYQIGAVLHDMIMKKSIFENHLQPYAELVNAVQNVTPEIENDAVDQDLIHIAKSSLLKNPEHRLEILDWDKLSCSTPTTDPKARVKEKIALKLFSRNETGEDKEKEALTKGLCHKTLEFLKTAARQIKVDEPSFPEFGIFSASENSVQLDFDSSESLSSTKYSVVLKLEIIDAKVEAIKLIGIFNSQEELDIYSGIHSEDELFKSLESAMYKFLEMAIGD